LEFDPKQGLPAGDPGPMAIEVPGKTAMLLVKLAQEIGAKTPGEVIGQALGLLQMLRQAKARGQRILLRDPATGHDIDLAI
jgi:hypothetical protein